MSKKKLPCGHFEEVADGTEPKEKCLKCWIQDQELLKEKIESESNCVELFVGSEKQIAWARNIRFKVMRWALKAIDKPNPKKEHLLAIEYLGTIDEAKFWIDNAKDLKPSEFFEKEAKEFS
jgi:hypothetical protein